MAAIPILPQADSDSTIEQRIALILDLTRRIQLLSELLDAAREKRSVTDTAVSPEDVGQAELDALMVW